MRIMLRVTPSATSLCLGVAILCPILMARFAQQPRTKAFRMAIYPLGVTAAVTSVIRMGDEKAKRRQIIGTDDSFIALFANYLLITNLALVGRFAFSDKVYRAHLLPRRPVHLADTRNRARILDICLSVDRKLNYPPNPPLRPSSRPSTRLQSVIRCITWTSIYGLCVDFFTLWLPLLKDRGLYRPDGTRDFAHLCRVLADESGLPIWLMWTWFMICYAGTVFCGIQAGWELARGLGVGSGIWIEEEWPDLMHRPFSATSMTDLWGRRYHQMLRSVFDTLLHPLRLSKALYLLGAFTVSGLYHILIMYPVSGRLSYHYLFFFFSCGMICVLERAINRLTGRKISGPVGWVWTWTWITMLGSWSLESEINSGQLEGFRLPVEIGGFSLYPLDYVVSYLSLDRR